jgi:hypothetical protein
MVPRFLLPGLKAKLFTEEQGRSVHHPGYAAGIAPILDNVNHTLKE